MTSAYWTRLADQAVGLKAKLDAALKAHKVEPVGSGYIDIITPPEIAEAFLEDLAQLGIASHTVTMWCKASDENKRRYGCPHGFGGPVQNGVRFSEMCETNPFDVTDYGINMEESALPPHQLASECKAKILAYIQQGMRARPEWSPCLWPGIWLAIPDDWISEGPIEST